jgi:hypothetical protein
MSTSPKQHAIRRSTRLPLEVPVLVTSLDAAVDFSEECKTTLVNAHGCGLIAQRAIPRDLPVRLEIVPAKRHTTARVADVVSLGGDPETWLLGMQLDAPGNFWGIEYAPSDWKIDDAPSPLAESKAPEASSTAQPTPPARRWRLTDISAAACYLEGAEPLPLGVAVLLSLRVASWECLLDGIVRASHPGLGMGVEFTSDNDDHRSRAEELIRRLMEQHEVPRVFVGRKETASEVRQNKNTGTKFFDEQPTDPLLQLVQLGDSMPVERFLDELKAQRQGQRAEPRIEVSLEVELSGTDTNGKPFQEAVRTSNVSRRGAQFQGVQAKLRAGDTISVTYDRRQETFRVAWAGASLTPFAGQVGVIATEQNTSFWDSAINDEAGQHKK